MGTQPELWQELERVLKYSSAASVATEETIRMHSVAGKQRGPNISLSTAIAWDVTQQDYLCRSFIFYCIG